MLMCKRHQRCVDEFASQARFPLGHMLNVKHPCLCLSIKPLFLNSWRMHVHKPLTEIILK